jgi:Zn finger protein HypA/HybF involved in hydrogenase expression
MSVQHCPKCRSRAFTWSVDDEVERYTRWRCSSCSYEALEDESKERACHICGGGDLWLSDDDRTYRFCLGCGRIAAI